MKNILYIGIDYSINSPAICILHDNIYNWISYPVIAKVKKEVQLQKDLMEIDKISLNVREPNVKSKNYSNMAYDKIMKFIMMSNYLLGKIQDVIAKLDYDEIIIGFEGYSFGSSGGTNNIIDIAEATAIFKRDLIKTLNPIKLNVYAPATVKKHAGHGRLKKPELFEIFKANKLNDELVERTGFWNYIKELIITTKKIPSPLDDMVDAYLVINVMKNIE